LIVLGAGWIIARAALDKTGQSTHNSLSLEPIDTIARPFQMLHDSLGNILYKLQIIDR
jgi:hypothetical protein